MEHFGQSEAGKGPWGQVTVVDFRLGHCLSADFWQVPGNCHIKQWHVCA